ncbi:hypothetical protein N9N67_00820 [Bacteriovoracaceae bacterium]|nr:hypothetical protein [Bacteriovoracaceae bacterium]
MGQEVSNTSFSDNEAKRFKQKLIEETKLLQTWFKEKHFSDQEKKCGLELEAWMVDRDFVPAPISDQFISLLQNPLVVPELSKFNFELNTLPCAFGDNVFSSLERQLKKIWKGCEAQAAAMDAKALIIGTLPVLRDHMLCSSNISPQKRYKALNDQIMKLRNFEPIQININGRDQVKLKNDNLFTECAATSLQIHYGVDQERAHHYYNASIIASAFMGAACANSPYFYGKEVWDESRVAIFEQSVNVTSFRNKFGELATRVGLGNGYVGDNLFEIFIENLNGYPILLPEVCEEARPEELRHLRLQNGTIWRWNRPLIGFDKEGKPNLRLEFRVPSAGPTIRDSIANTTLQIALVEYLASIDGLTEKIPFQRAVSNFYECCRNGLQGEVYWVDGKRYNVRELLLDQILPQLPKALINVGIQESEIQKYLHKVILKRVKKGQTGAKWQKAFVHSYGYRFQNMLEVYHQYQIQNKPVHLWKV